MGRKASDEKAKDCITRPHLVCLRWEGFEDRRQAHDIWLQQNCTCRRHGQTTAARATTIPAHILCTSKAVAHITEQQQSLSGRMQML